MTRIIQSDTGSPVQTKRFKPAIRLLGWLLLILGLGTVFLYGQTKRLSCFRQTDGGIDCTTQVFWFDLFILSNPESIQDVVQAVPATHCDSAGWAGRYECEFTEIKLSSADNSLLIGSSFFNTQTARETSDRVNNFLQQTSNQSLVISCGNFWTTLQGLVCVTPAFVLLGLLLIGGHRVLNRINRISTPPVDQQ